MNVKANMLLDLVNEVDNICRKGEAISTSLSNNFNGDNPTPLNDDVIAWTLIDLAEKFEEIRELVQAHHEAQPKPAQ